MLPKSYIQKWRCRNQARDHLWGIAPPSANKKSL